MTTARRLQLDDPLAPTQAAERDSRSLQSPERTPPKPTRDGAVPTGTGAQPPNQPANAPAGSRRARRGEPEPPADAPARENGLWRDWSGVTGVGSFRLPHELLVELGATARELALPIGMIATAAITQLLDQPPEQIAKLVDRADDARIHGRRKARRRLGERTGG